MTAAELQALRAKRVAQKVEGAYGYNPQVSKPKTLDPTMEAGRAFHFWGPLPDAGFSYGAYECSNCKNRSVLTAGIEQHCPHCGTSMEEPIREVPAETVQQAVATASFGDLFNVCPVCEKQIVTTIDPTIAKALTSVFCTQCGTDMPRAAEALKVVAQIADEPEEDKPAEVPVEPEADKPAEEEVPAPATDEPAAAESEEEQKPEEEIVTEPKASEPVSEGATVETLANLKDLEKVTANEVEMVLFAVNSDNPYWDVYMKGTPTARISLKDVPKHEEIKARFIDTRAFPSDVASGIEKFGYKEVFSSMNAKLFAYNIDKSETVARLRDEIRAEFDQERKEKIVTIKDQLLKAIKVAAQAANVNFFKGTDNTLKDSLYAQMDKAGVADPMAIIASAFEAGQTPYINSLLNKAVELMGMAPEAYAQVESAIASTNSPMQASAPVTAMSMRQKLEAGNVPIIATAGASIEAPVIESAPANYAQNLKSRIRLSQR
jgi:hypothetical protein